MRNFWHSQIAQISLQNRQMPSKQVIFKPLLAPQNSAQFKCAVLTSYGKKAGGGHLSRAKKLAQMLESYLQASVASADLCAKSCIDLCAKSLKIDFINTQGWVKIADFRQILQKSSLVIIDSYEVQKAHFEVLLDELESSAIKSSGTTSSVIDFSQNAKSKKSAKSTKFAKTAKSTKNTPKVLLLDDGIGFLDFVLESFVAKNTLDFLGALNRVFVLNGGLGSENLLGDFAKKIDSLADEFCGKHFLSNDFASSDFDSKDLSSNDFAKNAIASEHLSHSTKARKSQILRDFLKNNVFYGAEFFIKNADFDFVRKATKARIKDILLSFGASDSQNYTQKVANALDEIITDLADKKNGLARIFDSSVCVHIVLGEFYTFEIAHALDMTKSSPNHHQKRPKITHKIYQNLPPKDFASLMKKCDIAISAGGQSLYELAQSALPFVIIPTAQNQLAQSSAFASRAGAILLDDFVPQNPKKTLPMADLHEAILGALFGAFSHLTQKTRANISQNLADLGIAKSAFTLAHKFLAQKPTS